MTATGRARTACARCGRDPAEGLALINNDHYCHGDGPDQTCYEKVDQAKRWAEYAWPPIEWPSNPAPTDDARRSDTGRRAMSTVEGRPSRSAHERHVEQHRQWLRDGDGRGDPFVSDCPCCCSVCERLFGSSPHDPGAVDSDHRPPTAPATSATSP